MKTTDQVDADRDRDVGEPGHHHLSGHEIHEAHAKQMARMGWLAVGAMMLVTLAVLVFLMNRPEPPRGGSFIGDPLRDFRNWIMQVDINDEKAVQHARDRIAAERSFWGCTFIENDIVSKLRQFDQAFMKSVTPKNLLDKPAEWQAAKSASFKMSVGSQSLTLVNEANDGASSAGLTYLPGANWRDYVLEMEFQLDSGTLVIYTRIDEEMHPERDPRFSIGTVRYGTHTADVGVECGKPVSITVSMIGDAPDSDLAGQQRDTPSLAVGSQQIMAWRARHRGQVWHQGDHQQAVRASAALIPLWGGATRAACQRECDVNLATSRASPGFASRSRGVRQATCWHLFFRP